MRQKVYESQLQLQKVLKEKTLIQLSWPTA